MSDEQQRLLGILRCPETQMTLSLLDEAQVQSINSQIAQGELVDGQGRLVDAPIDGGLRRQDGEVVYPLRDSVYNFYKTDRLVVETSSSSEEE